MKKRIKKILILVVAVMFSYCVVDAVIETQQKVFPIKIEEVKSLDVEFPDINKSSGIRVYDEEREQIVDALNSLPMHVDETAKDEMIASLHISPYKKPVVASLDFWYNTNFLQRQSGTRIYFYEDGSFMVSEVEKYPPPLLLRWAYDPYGNFNIYAADDMTAYGSLLALLTEYEDAFIKKLAEKEQ